MEQGRGHRMKFLFTTRKEREIRTVKTMIQMYCKVKHHHPKGLCDSCAEIFSYASMKYHRCLFGEDKPVCSVCPVHCYSPEKREQIREIMRFSGPRMLFYHPVMAMNHLLLKRWSKENMPAFSLRVKSIREKKGKHKIA